MTLNDFIVFTIYTLLYTVGFGLLSISMLPLIEICNDNLKWKYIIGFFLLLIVSISLIGFSEIYKTENIEIINSIRLENNFQFIYAFYFCFLHNIIKNETQ